MHDRNMIKWAPFNSVINGKYLVKEIEKEKEKINKPVLDEEQVRSLEKKILEAKINKTPLNFIFYQDGFIYNKVGRILKIEYSTKKIYLDNNFALYFCEIIDLKDYLYENN